MNLSQIAQKGEKANSLLSNEIFSEAMLNLRQAITMKWQECPIRDIQAQHELKLMIKLLTDLEANIKRFVQDGKMAQFEIEEQRKRDEMRGKVARFM